MSVCSFVPPSGLPEIEDDTLFIALDKIIKDEAFWERAVEHGQFFEWSAWQLRDLSYIYNKLWARWKFNPKAPPSAVTFVTKLDYAFKALSDSSEYMLVFNVNMALRFESLSLLISSFRLELGRNPNINIQHLHQRYLEHIADSIRYIEGLIEDINTNIDKNQVAQKSIEIVIEGQYKVFSDLNNTWTLQIQTIHQAWSSQWFFIRWFTSLPKTPAVPEELELLQTLLADSQRAYIECSEMKNVLVDKLHDWRALYALLTARKIRASPGAIWEHLQYLEQAEAYYVARVAVVNQRLQQAKGSGRSSREALRKNTLAIESSKPKKSNTSRQDC